MVEHGCTAKRKVACGMLVGTAAERSHDYEQAAERYAWVLAQDPEDNEKRYFAHNNLAYSLNQLGRHREAEPHARSAIALDPELFNAHKNLGVAVEGQGRYLEAGYEYLESAYIYPLDFRARDHLIALVGKQPELREQIEGLDDEIEFLRRDLVKALEGRDEKLDKLRLARGDMANARMSCEKSLGTRQQPTHPDTTNPE
jgi:tetratricopeptide (TPR) repeat protein